jgi:hypothetical protein
MSTVRAKEWTMLEKSGKRGDYALRLYVDGDGTILLVQ